jgi:hypothetical protein
MRYTVIKAYRASSLNPIVLNQGDTVRVGKKYTEDPDWPGWIECESSSGVKGWVPEQYLAVSGVSGTALCDYSARELTVAPGDGIMVHNILNGWAWAQDANQAYGWVPLRNLAK